MGHAHWDRLAVYRGLASVLVAFGHLVQVFVYPISTALAPYSGLLAQASVMMFFVISGCSIAASANRSLDAPHPVRRYLLNRGGRILPPLIFALALMWGLSFMAPYLFSSGTVSFLPGEHLPRKGYFFDAGEAFGALAFLNGFFTSTPAPNGPMWSLSFEVWLYLIFFLLFLGLRKRRLLLLLLAVLIYAVLVRHDLTGSAHYFQKYSLIWFAGSLLWMLSQRYRIDDTVMPATVRTSLIVLAAVPMAYFAWRFAATEMSYDIAPFNVTFGLAFALYLLLTVPAMPVWVTAIFKPVSRCGYTLYLIHFPIFLIVFGATQSWICGNRIKAWGIGIASLAGCLCLAWVAALVVERRGLFVGRVG